MLNAIESTKTSSKHLVLKNLLMRGHGYSRMTYLSCMILTHERMLLQKSSILRTNS